MCTEGLKSLISNTVKVCHSQVYVGVSDGVVKSVGKALTKESVHHKYLIPFRFCNSVNHM